MTEWKCYDGLWCKSACTHRPFVLDNPNDHAVVDAAKVLCELKGDRGFCHSGRNIFFIPGEISHSKCKEELEAGRHDFVYTYLRWGWHKVLDPEKLADACCRDRGIQPLVRDGLETDLKSRYSIDVDVCKRTYKFWIKWGNVRASQDIGKSSWKIVVNLQQQLLGLTYKAAGTHAIIADIAENTDAHIAIQLSRTIADAIGNRHHEFIFEAWGPHAVYIKGEFTDLCSAVIRTVNSQRIKLPEKPIHVELIARVKAG